MRVRPWGFVVAVAVVLFSATGTAGAAGSPKTLLDCGVHNVWGVSGDVAVCTTYAPGYQEGRPPAETSIVTLGLSTGSVRRVVTRTTRMLEPDISGRYVVWWDERDTHGDIYGYDLLTETEFPIAVGSGGQTFPKVDGDYAVWVDTSSVATAYAGRLHIRGMNLRTGERFVVAEGPGYQYEPRIANGWVVYTDVSSGVTRARIRAYHIASKQTFTLASGFVHAPDIGDNGFVVWMKQSTRTETAEAYSCSVFDRKAALLVGRERFAWAPLVAGRIVAFAEHAKGGYQVVAYDTVSGTKFTVTPSPGLLQMAPTADGRIVLVQGNSSAWDPNAKVYVARPAAIGTYSAADRFSAAVAQSMRDFPSGAECAVVANGGVWDDVVVASGMAGTESPVLLSGRHVLPAAVTGELSRLSPKRVLVIGGIGSISQSVMDQIVSAVGTATVVERTGGSGPSDTALRALETLASGSSTSSVASQLTGGLKGTVVVVGRSDHVLSGAVAPAVRARRIPVVMADKRFSSRDMARLRAAGVKRAVVVGGKKSVSGVAYSQLARLLGRRNVVRIAGSSVYQTSAKFDDYAVRRWQLSYNGVGIAAPAATSDLLMAGLRNGRTGSLILLTGTKKLSKHAAAQLKRRRASIRAATYIGRGKHALRMPVRRAVRQIVR